MPKALLSSSRLVIFGHTFSTLWVHSVVAYGYGIKWSKVLGCDALCSAVLLVKGECMCVFEDEHGRDRGVYCSVYVLVYCCLILTLPAG